MTRIKKQRINFKHGDGVSCRISNVLREMQIVYWEDLKKYKGSDLLKYRNMGFKSLQELKALMMRHGVCFLPEWCKHCGHLIDA